MDILAELWGMAKQAGPFASALLLALWWLEREERKSERIKNDALVDRLNEGLANSTAAIRDLRETIYRAGADK